MNLLAIDTCAGFFSVACFINNECKVYEPSVRVNEQAEQLFSVIDTCLKALNLTFKDINALAVTNGPGSFTGLRIGLSAIKGLQALTPIKTYSATTLEVMAYGSKEGVLVALNAGKSEFYSQEFDEGKPVGEVKLISKAEISELSSRVKCILLEDYTHASEFLNAKRLGMLIIEKLAEGVVASENLEPIYVRKPDAVIPGLVRK